MSSIHYNNILNLKGAIVGISFIKYLMWFIIVYQLSKYEYYKEYENVFINVLKFCFFFQLLILVFQKFDILGFASGPFFYFVVKFYSIPNIYSTSSDIESLISTHMNFLFRPAGTFGSSTVTGLSMYIVGSVLYMKSNRKIYKVLAYFSAMICFAKIALVTAIFCDFILPLVIKFKPKKFILSIAFLPILAIVFYYSMEFLGVLHNFEGAVDGTDRGVTHRLDVVNYMANMSFVELFIGNLGVLPFGFFDSGTLLSIFRYGIIFYSLEYLLLLLMFFKLSGDKIIAFSFAFYVLFADLTFGSVFNPIFSIVIFFMFLSCIALKHNIQRSS
ncbi:hypothetical protein H8F06_17420 [Vibrio fluvialis]|uniref:hypothetical protein n=1 Tax=Vibrio fluvialis TaxID=676 RepID=UPI00192B56B5|nr:hypothetical protein [Vibrio fluvialis]MBL4297083.1 hypothetical protein [Vibrio fluvialis]